MIKQTATSIIYNDQSYPKTEDTTKLIFKDITSINTLQHTTFKTFGFDSNLQPDAFYTANNVCIIAELKKPDLNFSDYEKGLNQLKSYLEVVKNKFTYTIGIFWDLTSQPTTIIYHNDDYDQTKTIPIMPVVDYLTLIHKQPIDKDVILNNVAIINNVLDFLHVENFKDRMIFTACVLIANKEDQFINPLFSDFDIFITKTKDVLKRLKDLYVNENIDVLLDIFNSITLQYNYNQENKISLETQNQAKKFAQAILSINDELVKPDFDGSDVMMLFFNEFNHYNPKRKYGQVFTPTHIADLMFHLLNITENDHILDATCGSGTFLLNSFANLKSLNSTQNKQIENNLYGIEYDKHVFALSVANSLLHKEYYLHLENKDALLSSSLIKSWNITKVLMNPPYEDKYKPLKIIRTVLDNTIANSLCAFLLPNDKLGSINKNKIIKDLLTRHTLQSIIRLPEDVFKKIAAISGRCSIFIFQTFNPQKEHDIFTCSIDDDKFTSIKNKDRIDLKHEWLNEELYWINVLKTKQDPKYNTSKWIKYNDDLKYQDEIKINISTVDFISTILDYWFFKDHNFKTKYTNWTLNSLLDLIKILKKEISELDISTWQEVTLSELFEIKRGINTNLSKTKLKYPQANKDVTTTTLIPYVTRSKLNNGISDYILPLKDEKLNDANVLTVGADTNTVFYQEQTFYNGQNINLLINKELLQDPNVALFFTTIIRIYCNQLFYWGSNGATKDRLKELKILVPMKNNKVDIEVIKTFMTTLTSQLQFLKDLKW